MTAAGSRTVREATQTTPFDPLDPELLRDPFPAYRALRADPEIRRAPVGAWIVTRHADVRALVRDPDGLMQPPGTDGAAPLGDGAAARIHRNLMVLNDPPVHTRLRALAETALTRKAVEGLRERVERVVDDALDDIEPGDEFDGVAQLAYLVPYRVICGMLGVPESDRDTVLAHTPDFFRIFLPAANDADGIAACNRSCQFFLDYLGEQIERRRRTPGPDIFSALVRAEEQGDRLSHDERLSNDELVATVLALLTGGFDTTMGMLSAGLHALATDPAQLQALRADPAATVPTAVEEFLRWESPVQLTFRHFERDHRIRDTVVPAGDPIWLLLSAANRDDTEFAEPDRVEVTRTPNRHVAFGGSRHVCIGTHLARLEGTVTFRKIAERWSALEPAGEPARRPNLQFRSFERLPLRAEAP